MKRLLLIICIVLATSGFSYKEKAATYIRNTIKQKVLAIQQRYLPTQRVYKHMLNVDNFFVFGRIKNMVPVNRDAVAVIALSDRYYRGEVVDVSHFSGAVSNYGLNLPAGEYQLVVVSDQDMTSVR
jgi:hypothetical protein